MAQVSCSASRLQESPAHGPGGDVQLSPGGLPGAHRDGGVLACHCLRPPVQQQPVIVKFLVNIKTSQLQHLT